MTTPTAGRITLVLAILLLSISLAHATDHLIVSEVVVTPTGGEFIEIFNPTDDPIDLSDVYLTDATSSSSGTYYYNIVTGNLATAGGDYEYDFHARFPDGASIASHEYQTVGIVGSDLFFAEYGENPTYELFEDGTSPDAIPDMREALSGSIGVNAGISNAGEIVILYQWDGTTDLVQDLDYVLWGDKAEAVDKTGVSIDGPDAGTDTSTYLADTAIASQDVVATEGHAIGNSFTRVDLDEGTETTTGGNGVAGNDETSENLSATFSETTFTPNGGSLLGIGVSIDDVAEDEGDGGTTTFTFTISLSQAAPSGGVAYDIATSDGTATVAGLDYSAASDSQLIPEGSTTEVFNVEVIGDTDGEGNEVFTVQITNVSGTNAEILDGSGTGTIVNDDDLAINIVQGAGESSPLAGSVVTVPGVVVTAVGPEGFFIQTPDGLDDGDPDTSEGLYVFTDSAPSVAVGDLVDVTGTVTEFYDFTQLEAPAVNLSGTGTLPAPIVFDALTPSPDPWLPSCAIEYECREGMLVSAAGAVVGPTQYFGTDTTAEFFAIATTGSMPFREIGAEYPGIPSLPPTVPIFDGNPEIFEVDPDKLGQPVAIAKPGDTYTATGPLAYEYGGYEIWASAPVVLTSGPSVVVPVRPAAANEMTIASLNMYRFYDDVNDPLTQDTVVDTAEYTTRRAKFTRYILDVLRAPDVIGLQEVENLDVLSALAADIESADANVSYTAHLISGNNGFGMNVGYLVRDTVESVSITQLGYDDILVGWGYKLFDHPPLLMEGTWIGDGSSAFDFAVLNNHTRSLIDVDEPYDDFAREKRFQQAQSIASKVQDFQTADPAAPLVLVGDYNAYQFTDGYVDVIGQIRGEVTPEHNLLSGPEITSPTLTDEFERVPADQRYSYLYTGTRQILDHALTSRAARPYVVDLQYGRGNADSPGILIGDDSIADRASDHDGMVLYLDPVGELFADGFEIGDTSMWSNTTP